MDLNKLVARHWQIAFVTGEKGNKNSRATADAIDLAAPELRLLSTMAAPQASEPYEL
jgi:hypothetical protein